MTVSEKSKARKSFHRTSDIGEVRTPPQSLESEEAVIGAMLLSPEAIDTCLRVLNGNEFYAERHRILFAAIYSLHEARNPVDIRTLTNELERRKELDDVGGPTGLTTLIERVPTAANAEYYAQIVKEKFLARQLIGAATEIVSDAYADSKPAKELLEDAELKILTVTQIKEHGDISAEQWAIQETDRLLNAKTKPFIPTGFAGLDKKLGHDGISMGAERGVLTTLAGKKENGKTTLALNVMLNMAKNEVRVGAVCLEDSPRKLIYRMVCCKQGWSMGKLKSTDKTIISDEQKIAAFNKWAGLGMRIAGRKQLGRKWVRVKNWIKYQVKEHGMEFCIIDSGSMLEPTVERGWELFDAKEKMIDEISDLAEDLNIALWVTGHQAAKEGENLEMKGTNQWAHNARVQLHIGFHKDARHKDPAIAEQYKNVTVCQIVKNSDGDHGEVWLEGDRKTYRLKEFSEGEFAEQEG